MRLRRQIEEYFDDSTSVPESVEAVLAALDENCRDAEIELELPDRSVRDCGAVENDGGAARHAGPYEGSRSWNQRAAEKYFWSVGTLPTGR